MKATTCMIGILTGLSLTTTRAEDKKPLLSVAGLAAKTEAVTGDSLTAAWREKLARPFLSESAPRRIVTKRFVFGGPLVTLVKSDSPLQAFNPFAVSNSDMHADVFRRDPYLPPLRGFTLFRIEF